MGRGRKVGDTAEKMAGRRRVREAARADKLTLVDGSIRLPLGSYVDHRPLITTDMLALDPHLAVRGRTVTMTFEVIECDLSGLPSGG